MMSAFPAMLSQHFSLESLEHSQKALDLGIDNTPPDSTAGNALRLAESLETCRAFLCSHYGKDVPMVPTSGFRCLELNHAVGGAGIKPGQTLSAHCDFRACDFHPLGVNLVDAFEALRRSGLPFDQLILEMDSRGDLWIHWGIAPEGVTPRQEVLRGLKTPTGSTYTRLP